MKSCHTCAKENRDCPWDGTYRHRDEKGNLIKLCNGYEGLSGSILISIRPNWTAPIKDLKKKWEIRKTIPKLKPPFKCYIYETLGKMKWDVLEIPEDQGGGVFDIRVHEGCGKVIGEFICDRIVEVGFSPYPNHGTYICEVENIHEESCVDFEAMFDYIGDGYGYAWHISGLVIYSTPRDLGQFIVPSKTGCCNEGKCRGCMWLDKGNGFNVEDDCNAPFCTDEYKPMQKAPQSWCYAKNAWPV